MGTDSIPRSRARVLAVAALLVGMVFGAVALRVSGLGGDDGSAELSGGTPTSSPSPTTPPTEPGTPTTWRLSSLNVLGAGHTGANGRKRGWASGEVRMQRLTGVIARRGIDVIALQEFERPQYNVFVQQLGTRYATYPGTSWGRKAMHNSVAWRTDRWELVSATAVKIPYFHGILRRMPVVLLRSLQTGQQAYFTSFHNPANARGPAEKWRDQATRIEISLVNRLESDSGLPVYVLGDMNEHAEYFCKMTSRTDLIAAAGGTNNAAGCRPTQPVGIDWIFGSPQTTFTDYTAARNAVIRRSTDHPMVIVNAELPALPPACTMPPDPSASPTAPASRPTGSAAPAA